MNLAELKEAYKARKLALDSAKKEEEKYKALLKDAMLEAGESDYTDTALSELCRSVRAWMRKSS